jgi:hypothetical protein
MPPTLSISNRLLRSLAADDLDPFRPHLHAVTLSHRQALSKPGTPIDVYFVQDGMVSLVQPLENGAMIEVRMIGNEGFVGVPVLFGAETSPLETIVQIPGSALRMQASGIVNLSGRGMLVVSVARQLGLGNSFARLLCCPAQAELAGKRRLRSAKLTMPQRVPFRGSAPPGTRLAFHRSDLSHGGLPRYRPPPGRHSTEHAILENCRPSGYGNQALLQISTEWQTTTKAESQFTGVPSSRCRANRSR